MPLRGVSLVAGDADRAAHYPFDIPVVRAFRPLAFDTPVTFLVGENGSGKSTFLEALAVAAGSTAAGSAELGRDPTLAPIRELAGALRLSWSRRTRRGFFLRAEDFFGYARRLTAIREGLERDLADVDTRHADSTDHARELARTPFRNELRALRSSYGGDLGDRSHGEGFLDFFRARLVPDGLYLLDEPEVPLSPLRQLAFLALLREVVEEQGAQCIIATHSPILMAFPGATILSFDEAPIAPVRYGDLEHVTITRDFLNDPTAFLRRL